MNDSRDPLPYNKYGQWVDGEWMPYDDMELA